MTVDTKGGQDVCVCVFVTFHLRESTVPSSQSERETEMSAVLINIPWLLYEATDVLRGRCAAGRRYEVQNESKHQPGAAHFSQR